MLSYQKLALGFLMVFVFIAALNAKTINDSDFSDEGFKLGLIEGLSDPARIDAKLNVYGLLGSQRDVARRYLESLPQNQKYIDYLFDRFSEVKREKKKQKDDVIEFNLSPELLLTIYKADKNLFENGLERMPDKIRKEYLSLLATAYLKMDSKYCRYLMYSIVGSELISMEASLRMLSVLSVNELERYFEITKSTIDAELTKYPPKMQITEFESVSASKSFDYLLRANFEELGQPAFLLSLTKPEASSDEDICLAGSHVVKMVKEMPGKQGEWFRYKFLK